jgi:hypothetical protein
MILYRALLMKLNININCIMILSVVCLASHHPPSMVLTLLILHPPPPTTASRAVDMAHSLFPEVNIPLLLR